MKYLGFSFDLLGFSFDYQEVTGLYLYLSFFELTLNDSLPRALFKLSYGGSGSSFKIDLLFIHVKKFKGDSQWL